MPTYSTCRRVEIPTKVLEDVHDCTIVPKPIEAAMLVYEEILKEMGADYAEHDGKLVICGGNIERLREVDLSKRIEEKLRKEPKWRQYIVNRVEESSRKAIETDPILKQEKERGKHVVVTDVDHPKPMRVATTCDGTRPIDYCVAKHVDDTVKTVTDETVTVPQARGGGGISKSVLIM